MADPAVHSVHIYDELSSLINRLCGIVASGLKLGNAVLIVARLSVREGLVRALTDAGIDIREHAREQRFAMYDASEMLATFMIDGTPNPAKFDQSVGGLLKEARRNSRSKDHGVTVFGEMVAVLWEAGHRREAIELEHLWNRALSQRAFHLHCAYPRWTPTDDDSRNDLAAVYAAHSHVVADLISQSVTAANSGD